MSRTSPPYIPVIKLEHDSDDDLIGEQSGTNSSSQSSSTVAFPSTYKGKIEVTSKGRRKIFDGVRWQILCRRPDCRKQTNKKSLCITHYKEEYENPDLPSLSVLSYSYPSSTSLHDLQRRRTTTEDRNDFINPDEHYSVNISEGEIKFKQNGQRYIFMNRKWYPLCKYDNICRSMAKYEFLCIKHFQTAQRSSSTDSEDMVESKRIRRDLSVIEQFNINSVETPSSASQLYHSKTSSSVSHHRDCSSSPPRIDQSVQTDITIPDCCFIHHGNHSFFSSCNYEKSTSSTKSSLVRTPSQLHFNRSSR